MATAPATYASTGSRTRQGAVGGLVGGLAMIIASMLWFPLMGLGFWQPPNLVAAVLHQPWGRIEGFAAGPTLIGLAVHLAVSAALGALFGRFAFQLTRASLVLWAVAAAAFVWLVAYWLVLPAINPIMTQIFPVGPLFLVHLLYGLGLGGYLALARRPAGDQ